VLGLAVLQTADFNTSVAALCAHMHPLQGLQHLNISWITLGPNGVAFASCLAALRMLVMSGMRAGPAAIAALHRARPGLQCLELFDSLETNAGW
jgi:hypothetical protein